MAKHASDPSQDSRAYMSAAWPSWTAQQALVLMLCQADTAIFLVRACRLLPHTAPSGLTTYLHLRVRLTVDRPIKCLSAPEFDFLERCKRAIAIPTKFATAKVEGSGYFLLTDTVRHCSSFALWTIYSHGQDLTDPLALSATRSLMGDSGTSTRLLVAVSLSRITVSTSNTNASLH